MSVRLARLVALALAASAFGSSALIMDGCGSDSTPAPGIGDGSTTDSPGSNPDGSMGDGSSNDGSSTDGGKDGGANGKGETCIGFAKGKPCGAGGLPDYGYVCFNGSPPGIAGCVLASSSSLGESWCCTENKCVAQPDQDTKECGPLVGAATPHRYQCPPRGGDAGTVAPPSGCADAGSGGTALEVFYCCP